MTKGYFDRAWRNLTERQEQILRKVVAGESDDSIAESLAISQYTVRSHIRNICSKFGLEQEHEGDRRSLRPALFELCQQYRPELSNAEQAVEQYQNLERNPLTSSLYVERVLYEQRCYEEILKPGALIRIKAPQQMGKSWFLDRVLDRIRQQEYRTVSLSFELADRTVLSDLRTFVQWFCAYVADGLELPNQIDEYWDDIFGHSNNCTRYFQKYLLTKISSPLVLALDKFDRLFEHSAIFSDFCALLRRWYETARQGDRMGAIWKQLRLVVVHSTEVYSSLDINHSPFNVGFPIELPEFNSQQVWELVRHHEVNWHNEQIQQLMKMIGGHPALVRQELDYIELQQLSLEEYLSIAPTEAGPYKNHLRQQLQTLQQHPDLATAFSQVIVVSDPIFIQSEQAFKLYGMGLVRMEGNGVVPRCELYRQYFLSCLHQLKGEG